MHLLAADAGAASAVDHDGGHVAVAHHVAHPIACLIAQLAVSRSSGEATVVYTDGACSGNPGPGGWAWAEPGAAWASGYEARSTNQRMEIAAAAEAVAAHPGAVEIVTDSTYVKNCFDKRWFDKWHANGWRNSAKQPVKNRDLWEPFIDHFLARPGEIRFRWVKGHSGDPMNDLVDRLAVAACTEQRSGSGSTPPDSATLGPPDAPPRRRVSGLAAEAQAESPGAQGMAAPAKVTPVDSRVPEGHRLVVFGHRPPELGGYSENPLAAGVRRLMGEILAAKAVLHPDLILLTGLGLGAETLAAEAAVSVGVPFAVVLPYPEPQRVWSVAFQDRYRALVESARSVITLERKDPKTKVDARSSLARRDGWMIAHADEAILVWDRELRSLRDLHTKLEKRLGDDLWVIEP